jgi:hypothetical protein
MTLKREIDADLKALEVVRQLCLHLVEDRRQFANSEAALGQLTARRPQAEANKYRCQDQVRVAGQDRERCIAVVQRHRKNRPGVFARLFRTERWKAWSRANRPLIDAMFEAVAKLKDAERALSGATAALDTLTADIRKTEEHLSGPRQKVAQLSQQIDTHRRLLGDRLVDEQFFAEGHEASNLASPWIPDSLHRKREDLFIAALGVHRAFIDSSAQKVLHNLSVLMDVFSGGPPQDEVKRKLLSDLWSTLFLVVPVVSTTFASVERMLGDLPAGSIGWLLVDEAGQALP